MQYKEIISISGRPGLFHILSQTRTGVVALALADGKRVTTNPSEQVSVLNDIQLYTHSGEKPIKTIFEAMAEKEKAGLKPVSPKASKADLQSYFEAVVPDYDLDRVYPNHIKKIIQWYLLLQALQLLSDSEDAQAPADE
jgi:hypothetical protein